MILTYHSEFGLTYKASYTSDLSFPDPLDINHWLEQWLKTYTMLFQKFMCFKRVKFICYEKLCNEPDYWATMQELINIKSFYNFIMPLEQIANPKTFNENLMGLCKELYEAMANEASSVAT